MYGHFLINIMTHVDFVDTYLFLFFFLTKNAFAYDGETNYYYPFDSFFYVA